jgi:hypothetical protein
VTIDGRWHPGIGDPTAMGWLTVVAYLLAALLCAAAAWREREATIRQPGLWAGLAVMLLALGINKQLDLQTLFTQVARDAAMQYGWYAQRRMFQTLFVAGIAAIGIIAAIAIPKAGRVETGPKRLALAGTVMLMVYVIERAASFHHVDVLINRSVWGAKLNWVLELGGILVVALSAMWSLSKATWGYGMGLQNTSRR